MVVQFTNTPALSVPALPALVLNNALFPVLNSKHGNNESIDAVLLRVILKALAVGISANAARRWASANAEAPVAAAAANPAHWFRLLQSGRRHFETAGSPAGLADLRLRIARLEVARITTPIPDGQIPYQRQIAARAALAVIANQQRVLGFESILVSGPWLGTQLGLSRQAAAGALKTLERDLHWIRRTGQRGSAIKYKLTRLTGPLGDELRDRALLHGNAVDALASLSPADDPLAEIINSAGHPAWHYSRARPSAETLDTKPILGTRAWLSLVHQYAVLPASEGLGITKGGLTRVKKMTSAELPGAFDRLASLTVILDEKALATGALILRAERDARNVVDVAANRARIAEFRAAKADRMATRKALAATLRAAWSNSGAFGRIPADLAELAGWTSRAAQAVAEGGLVIEPEMIVTAREFLTRQVTYRTGDAEKAAKVASFVFRDAPAAT